MPVHVRGQVAVLASAVGFGVGTALSVVALRTLRPADLLAVELAGSALVLVAVAAATGRLRRAGAVRAMAQGAVAPGLSFLLGDLGLARTTATSGSLLLGTDAVLTVLLAVLVLHERISRAAAAALALGLAGTVLVSLGTATAADGASGSVTGNLLVVAAVVSGAAYVVWSRRSAQAPDAGVGLTAWQFVGAATAVSPFVLASWLTGGSRIAAARPEELLAAAAVLVTGLGALLAFNLGIGAVTASRAGLLFGLQPVAGTLTAVTALGEPLGAGQAAGGALIVLGVLVLTRGAPDPAPTHPPAVEELNDPETTTNEQAGRCPVPSLPAPARAGDRR